jgi:pyridoxal phosphate enzyme (YggS family)
MNEIVDRFQSVKRRIAAAEVAAGRPAGSVTLVAVSKTFDAEAIRPLLSLGHRVFGENRVQEAKGKWPALRTEYPGVELHLIGPLQSNKAREAVALFDVIQTVDRHGIVEALADEIAEQKRTPRLFVEVNTGGEAQKSGIAPKEAETFVALCREMHGLLIDGLMCIPPVRDVAAPHFALLAKIARRLGLTSLSMGMSADFETAIKMGATHVRIGSAIFGERPQGG